MATCYDVYIIFIPPDPSDLVGGSNTYGTTIIMMSPPPPGFLPGNCKVSTLTVCPEIPDPVPQPPTGGYTPPDKNPFDLDFEEGETDEGDPYYEAPLPDTEGEDYEFDIDIPLEEGEDPETVSLNFTHGGFRLSGVLGTTYIYAADNNNLHRLDALTGTVLKTWEDDNIYNVYSNSNSGAVVILKSSTLYYLDSNDSFIQFFTSTGDGFWGGFDLDDNFLWFQAGEIAEVYIFDSDFVQKNRLVLRDYSGGDSYSDNNSGYYNGGVDFYNEPDGEGE